MSDRLESARDAVVDETSFVEFLRILASDWVEESAKEASKPTQSSSYGPGANGWENSTIGTQHDPIEESAFRTWLAARRPVAIAPSTVPLRPSASVASPARKRVPSIGFARSRAAPAPPTRA